MMLPHRKEEYRLLRAAQHLHVIEALGYLFEDDVGTSTRSRTMSKGVGLQ